MDLSNSAAAGAFKECPRCLGKGHVDPNDIKRLKRESEWLPASCAYCNGSGKVDWGMEDKVPVDVSYLVMDLTENERKKIAAGDQDAIERAKRAYESRSR